METTVETVDRNDSIQIVATVGYPMESDTASSEASQEIEDTQPSDIVESSKLKLSSDLEKSFKVNMLGADLLISRSGSGVALSLTYSVTDSCWRPDPEYSMICSWNLTGTIGDVTIYSVSDHLNLASMMKLELMGKLVQKKLIDSLDPSNCIQYLIMAHSHPLLLGLREKAIKIIVDNLSNLVTLEEWEDLTESQPSLTTEILRTNFMR